MFWKPRSLKDTDIEFKPAKYGQYYYEVPERFVIIAYYGNCKKCNLRAMLDLFIRQELDGNDSLPFDLDCLREELQVSIMNNSDYCNETFTDFHIPRNGHIAIWIGDLLSFDETLKLFMQCNPEGVLDYLEHNQIPIVA